MEISTRLAGRGESRHGLRGAEQIRHRVTETQRKLKILCVFVSLWRVLRVSQPVGRLLPRAARMWRRATAVSPSRSERDGESGWGWALAAVNNVAREHIKRRSLMRMKRQLVVLGAVMIAMVAGSGTFMSAQAKKPAKKAATKRARVF